MSPAPEHRRGTHRADTAPGDRASETHSPDAPVPGGRTPEDRTAEAPVVEPRATAPSEPAPSEPASLEGAGGDGAGDGAHVETVGAFDIRTMIGALIGLFGAILTVLGLVAFTAAEAAKTGGVNANLWSGLVMLAVAAAFLLWARLEPIRIVVRDNEPGAEEPHDIQAL